MVWFKVNIILNSKESDLNLRFVDNLRFCFLGFPPRSQSTHFNSTNQHIMQTRRHNIQL